jgi:hypothetical protein
MSQRNVERVIGRLVTDEGFRHRFAADPSAALAEMSGCGMDLTDLERRALVSIDPNQAERFADAIDPRIQKVELAGGQP